VRSKTVRNQHSWFPVNPSFGLGIKDTLEPLKANLGVGVPRFGTRIMPSRGKEGSLVTSMGSSWPNYY
jgi:hypothetical protein